MCFNIYIFNDKGEIIAQGYGETKPMDITGRDMSEYKTLLDKYSELQNLILTEMAVIEDDGDEE